ncbi:MAG: hypothetical protein Q8K59_07485 [Nitrosomonas sp.]|nr:hypothetical protein [Nitrosomonas sp.]MDP1950919.1 hypothetical protein [Nitrosomonas sp.]
MQILARTILVFFVISILSGCLSPIVLNRAVEAYDNAAIRAESRLLLTNIARAQHHEPLHFTRVSNIAATFNFSANAGAMPTTVDRGGILAPIFGGGVSENPTFSIEPIEGEEFTKRLLTPFSQHKLTLLLRQHFDIDLMLRMMAQEVRLQHTEQQTTVHNNQLTGLQLHHHNFLPGIQFIEEQEHRLRNQQRTQLQQTIYHNSPSDQIGYEMFRRVVLHLSAIQGQKNLFAEPLTFESSWTIPVGAVSAEGLFQAIEKEFTMTYDQQNGTYTLSKQLLGPILITNYNPAILCCEEREALRNLANPWIGNDVAFDIRPGFPGGEWPVRGAFRLRSLHTILNFLAHSLSEEAEYHVEKDPRTLSIARDKNPSHTMGLIITDEPPSGVNLFTYSHDKYYAVDTTGLHSHWNRNAFQLLYILFRMTVTDAKSLGLPITISK